CSFLRPLFVGNSKPSMPTERKPNEIRREPRRTATDQPAEDCLTRGMAARARDQLLIKEKAATKARDALSVERRRLPMVRKFWGETIHGTFGLLITLMLPPEAGILTGEVFHESLRALSRYIRNRRLLRCRVDG